MMPPLEDELLLDEEELDEEELEELEEELLEELLEEELLPGGGSGTEHSFTPPATRPPKVAAEHTNTPLSCL